MFLCYTIVESKIYGSKDMTGFGERLAALMAIRGVTKKELAERAGLSLSSVSAYLGGSHKPTADSLMRLADALATSTDYLLGRSEIYNVPRESEEYKYIVGNLMKLDDFRLKNAVSILRSAFEYLIDE